MTAGTNNDPTYEIDDLIEIYAVSRGEAERLLSQFGADRDGLDLLLGRDVHQEDKEQRWSADTQTTTEITGD